MGQGAAVRGRQSPRRTNDLISCIQANLADKSFYGTTPNRGSLNEEVTMSKNISAWLRLILGGALLFGASISSCVADALRDTANEIDDETSLEDVGDEIEDWWDDLWD